MCEERLNNLKKVKGKIKEEDILEEEEDEYMIEEDKVNNDILV